MNALLAQPQPLDERLVRLRLCALEVIEELPAAAHHAQQSAARVVILHVSFEVLGEVGDTRSQERNLDFG